LRTTITVNSMLTACSSALQWQMALHLWQGHSAQASEATFGALMDAAGGARDWRLAIHLLQLCEQSSVPLNVVIFSSALKALHPEWRSSLRVLQLMAEKQVTPNVLTIDTVMASLRCHWQQALMLAGCELSTAALLSLKSACDLAGQGRAAEAASAAAARGAEKHLRQPMLQTEDRPLCAMSQYLDLPLPALLLRRRLLEPLCSGEAWKEVDILAATIARFVIDSFGFHAQTKSLRSC
ncbi:unnamed protein product, partial [Effrenium voratum]